MSIDRFIDKIDADEYEEIFPEDQEYKNWMASIERDFAKETAKIKVDGRMSIFLGDDDIEDDEDF